MAASSRRKAALRRLHSGQRVARIARGRRSLAGRRRRACRSAGGHAHVERPRIPRGRFRQHAAAASIRLLPHMIDETGPEMSRSELIIQLIKVALGIAIGAYFVWWSLEVLQRMPPP